MSMATMIGLCGGKVMDVIVMRFFIEADELQAGNYNHLFLRLRCVDSHRKVCGSIPGSCENYQIVGGAAEK